MSVPRRGTLPPGEGEGGLQSKPDEGMKRPNEGAGAPGAASDPPAEKPVRKPLRLPSRLFTLVLILIGWMIFAIEDMHELPRYAAQIFGFGAEGFAGNTFLYWLGNYGFVLIIGLILSQPVFPRIRKLAEEKTALANLLQIMAAALTILLTLVCAAALISDGYNPFLYFRF